MLRPVKAEDLAVQFAERGAALGKEAGVFCVLKLAPGVLAEGFRLGAGTDQEREGEDSGGKRCEDDQPGDRKGLGKILRMDLSPGNDCKG